MSWLYTFVYIYVHLFSIEEYCFVLCTFSIQNNIFFVTCIMQMLLFFFYRFWYLYTSQCFDLLDVFVAEIFAYVSCTVTMNLSSFVLINRAELGLYSSDVYVWPSSSPATELLEDTCGQQTFQHSPVDLKLSDPFDLFRLRRKLFSLQTNNWRFLKAG